MLGKIKKDWAKYLALAIVVVFILIGASLKRYQGVGVDFVYPRFWILRDRTDSVELNDPLGAGFLDVERLPINEPGVDYFNDPESFYAIYEDNPQFKAIDNYKFDNKRAVFVSFTTSFLGEYWEQYWVKSDHYRYDIFLTRKTNGLRSVYYKTITGLILSTMHLEN